MIHNPHSKIYISSCVVDGGIYSYEISQNGDYEEIEYAPLDRPMYTIEKDNKLYALLREPFADSKHSGLLSLDIDHDGKLINKSACLSTNGEVACHLCIDGNAVYCVNYISGSVIKMNGKTVTHVGKGESSPRQDSPHTHFVGVTPDKKYIYVTDLGLDTIFVYDKELNFVSSSKVPSGHGVRHIAFSDDGKTMFSANELASTVSAFEYRDGSFKLIDTVSILPKNNKAISTASAIRYFNGKIYASNRGHDSISVLEYKNSKLELCDNFSVCGKSPRDFIVDDKFIYSTNELSNTVTLLSTNDYKLINTINVKAPVCVTLTKEND